MSQSPRPLFVPLFGKMKGLAALPPVTAVPLESGIELIASAHSAEIALPPGRLSRSDQISSWVLWILASLLGVGATLIAMHASGRARYVGSGILGGFALLLMVFVVGYRAFRRVSERIELQPDLFRVERQRLGFRSFEEMPLKRLLWIDSHAVATGEVLRASSVKK